MGCDIHVFIEFVEMDGVHWRSFGGEFRPNRCYETFGKIAGVRGGNPLVVPHQITSLGPIARDAFQAQKLDLHNSGWLHAEEFDDATHGESSDEYAAIVACAFALAKKYAVRIVFWFDN